MFKEELQFIKKPITTRVKSFDDACRVLGLDVDKDLNILLGLENNKELIGIYKLKIIVEALNEGWKPNFLESEEYMYYPYYIMKVNKFALYDSVYDRTNSHGGLYICFKSKELSEYFGNNIEFTQLYNQSCKK